MAVGDYLGKYDPDQVVIQVGPIIVSGYADGTFVSIERDDNEINKGHAGAGGEVSRTKNNNRMGTITFTLKQTSPSHRSLMLLKESDINFPMSVVNNSDRKFSALSAESWFKTEPPREFGDEESMVEYQIACANLIPATLE